MNIEGPKNTNEMSPAEAIKRMEARIGEIDQEIIALDEKDARKLNELSREKENLIVQITLLSGEKLSTRNLPPLIVPPKD